MFYIHIILKILELLCDARIAISFNSGENEQLPITRTDNIACSPRVKPVIFPNMSSDKAIFRYQL